MKYSLLAVLAVMSSGIAHADESVMLNCKVHWKIDGTDHQKENRWGQGNATLFVSVEQLDLEGGGTKTSIVGQMDKSGHGQAFFFKSWKDSKEATTQPDGTYVSARSDEDRWAMWRRREIPTMDYQEEQALAIDRIAGTLTYTSKNEKAGVVEDERRIEGTCKKIKRPEGKRQF
jgi:hypothetical protein